MNNPYDHHSRVGGYMSYPPVVLRNEVYLAGLSGTSGAAVGHDQEVNQASNVMASNATSAWWVAN